MHYHNCCDDAVRCDAGCCRPLKWFMSLGCLGWDGASCLGKFFWWLGVIVIISGAIVTGVCGHPHGGHACKEGSMWAGVGMMIIGTYFWVGNSAWMEALRRIDVALAS